MITRLRQLLRTNTLAGIVPAAAYILFRSARSHRARGGWAGVCVMMLGFAALHRIEKAQSVAAIETKPQAKTLYVITDLGALPDGNGESSAVAINANGQVVGNSNVYGTSKVHAFLWQDGKMSDLGAPQNGSSYASGINDDGLIVGAASNSGGRFTAAVWRDRAARLLDVGGTDSSAQGVNQKGLVVGGVGYGHSDGHTAFSWRNDKSEALGYFFAYSVNNGGEIAGDDDGTRDIKAVVYRNGTIHYLPEFDKDAWSVAYAINDKGRIAGWSFLASGGGAAVLWEKDTVKSLGGLGGSSACAYAINNQGQIVGFAETAQGQLHAFLWQEDKMTDLNEAIPRSSGWTLTYASGINARGQIVGTGQHEGKERAFLLTPQSR